MEWSDEGLVLARRHHGETSAVVSLFTSGHGRHLGLVRGGSGRRAAGLYDIGNVVGVRWRARLEEQLGTFAGELVEAMAARVLDDAVPLECLASAMALLEAVLPERQPYGPLYAATRALLDGLDSQTLGADMVRWELGVLTALGFGLDLGSCALTGTVQGLAYVSPRSGRAVNAQAGAAYAGRLLALPAFLTDPAAARDAAAADVAAGLVLTGHFIERHLLAPVRRQMPPARLRLVDRWSRGARLPAP
ncbi:MAG: DNA repair protein RecO [Alphaproteobacteria bacterium]|nr:DNA repair protein RecO [Alphaproteobacteria bacterium]